MKMTSVALALALVAAGCAPEPPLPPGKPVSTYPIPTGTFIQNFLVKDWTDAQWQTEIRTMKECGIDTIVFAPCAEGPKNHAYYTTRIPGFRLAPGYPDLVENLLRNAKKGGVKVFLGLNFHDDWWKKGSTDPQWLYDQMEVGNKVADELYARYHARYPKTFVGWYWVWEVDNYCFHTEAQAKVLAKAIDVNVKHVKSLDPNMPVMLCPFMNYRLGTPQAYAGMWTTVFANCSLGKGDVFCPQDCVGAGGLNMDNFLGWFAALRNAVDTKPGLLFWSDAETFVQADWTSATLDRFVRQMKGVQPYVDNIITFAFSHYYGVNNTNPGWQKTLRDYVKTGKLDATPPPPIAGGSGRVLANGAIELTWSAAFDNMGDCGYDVYRNGYKVKRIEPPKQPRKKGATVTWIDSAEGGRPEAKYEVQCYDFAGNVSPKTAVTVSR